MKPVKQLALSLKETKVRKVLLEEITESEAEPFLLNFSHLLLKDGPGFFLQFECAVTHQAGVKLSVKFIAEFVTDKQVTAEFCETDFAKINAPAIAYPFLRAYIANFFISSGYDALMLPTINFQAMARNS